MFETELPSLNPQFGFRFFGNSKMAWWEFYAQLWKIGRICDIISGMSGSSQGRDICSVCQSWAVSPLYTVILWRKIHER